MDPELKAAVAGLKRGSPEYQKAVDKFNAAKAKRQGEEQERSARLAREAEEARSARETREADAKAARDKAERESREAGERAKAEQQAEKDRRTSLITAGSTAGGLAAGLGGGYAADKYGTAKANSILEGRASEARNLASAARAIDPSQPGARARYANIGTAANRTGVTNPRVVPIGGLGVAGALGGAGAYSTFYRAPHAQSDEERAIWTGTGYGEMGAGAKMLASSANRYFNPGVTLPADAIADIEFARQQGAGSGQLGGYNQAPAQPAPGQAPAAPAQPQTSQVRNSQRIINAARAAGATGKLTKESAAKYLARKITDENRAAVASELGVKPGPNFATRTQNALKAMAKTRGVSSIMLPAAVGTAAYDAATSQAQAAGSENPRRQGLLSGLTAAGATAAIPYAISKLPAAVGRGLNAGAPGMAPMGIDSMTDYNPEELAYGRNLAARVLPAWARGGAIESAYQMAQVPERNPYGSDFDSALNDVISYLEQAPQQ